MPEIVIVQEEPRILTFHNASRLVTFSAPGPQGPQGDATPDATSSVKGILKLTNDLGGTADLPTVPGLATKQPLDSDLTSIAGLSATNDDVIQRKSGAWTNRSISQFKTDLAYTTGDIGAQPLDSDLTDIAALSPTNDDLIQRKSGAWTNRTPAQFKTDLALVKGDVGLGNVDNTSDANKPISTATQTALDAKQGLDSDLTSIAGLSPTNDDIIQRKSGAWTNRTIAQLKTDLAYTASTGLTLSGSDFRLDSSSAGDGLSFSSGVLSTNSTVPRIYATSTHASTTSIAITHNLGRQYVQAAVYVTATGERVNFDMIATSTTVSTFTFGIAPSANTLTFNIIG